MSEPPQIFLSGFRDALLFESGNRSLGRSGRPRTPSLHLDEGQNRAVPGNNIELTELVLRPAVPSDDRISGLAQIPISQCLAAPAGIEMRRGESGSRSFPLSLTCPPPLLPEQSTIDEFGQQRHRLDPNQYFEVRVRY